MKQFQISELASRYPKQLSGGQRQRVALARLMTTAISFLTQRTAEQFENITIMCDGQQVHECTDSEQMVALLQSGRAVFGVSVGSLWKQIRETLAHEEYVDLTTVPSMMGGNRPVDDITAMRMRKNFEAQHQTRAAASL